MVYVQNKARSALENRRFCAGANKLAYALAAAFLLCLWLLSAGVAVANNSGAATVGSDTAAAPLRVELQVEGQSLVARLFNDSGAPLAFLPWGSPFGEVLDADVLSIRDTEVLPGLQYELLYNGLLLKRGDPQHHNMVTLSAGQSVAARITPADHYAIDIASTYQIRYRGSLRYTTKIDELNDQSLAIRHDLLSIALESDPVTTALAVPPETRAAVAPAFASCSATQQSELQSALQSAETIARNASVALGSLDIGQRSDSPRYAQWFGAYSETRFNIVNAGFRNIRSVLENNRIDFICGCLRDGTFAFINRARPFEINLCPAFWPAAENGRDSRAGTIVHELSHFNEILGTNDFRYGQGPAADLALSSPDQAVLNADNYEYFAENTPAIDISGSETGTGVAQLPLGTEIRGSAGNEESRYYSVSGARSISLTSVNGDADLYIYRSLNDEAPFCQSTTTGVVDVCAVDALPTAIVRVYAFTAAEFRLFAESGVVTPQGGNSGSTDNGGSMGVTLLVAGLFMVWLRRRSRSFQHVDVSQSNRLSTVYGQRSARTDD
jgi:peptidyl-Lys metalloendopeptidase